MWSWLMLAHSRILEWRFARKVRRADRRLNELEAVLVARVQNAEGPESRRVALEMLERFRALPSRQYLLSGVLASRPASVRAQRSCDPQ